MTSHDIDRVLGWRGRDVLDRDGERIGKLGDVYLDGRTDRPAWAGVRTGLFGARESLVPLEGAEEAGDDLRVPWEKDLVKDAPDVDAEVEIDEEAERRLLEHYGRGTATAPAPAGPDAAEVVRSEEEPVVTDRVERRPAERVRIKKVQVTEQVERKVPVRKEVVEVVEDPPARS
jgi:sporulation protein YlmC with PRC-barrel domain